MAEKRKMVSAIFRNRLDAEQALDYLHAQGYRDDEINVLMSDKMDWTAASPEEHRTGAGPHVAEGAGVGGAIGTAIGAAAAGIAAIGTSIAIPGLGLLVAGPIAAGLAGAGVGAVTGGTIGALVGLGMDAPNAEAWNEAIRRGAVALGVYPRNKDDVSRLEDKFREFNGESVCYC
jgi:hypothetical protein